MIRQLISPPTYKIVRKEQDITYKPTIAMLMDCEVSPNKNTTLLHNYDDLVLNYYTESNNQSFNIAKYLLSTNNFNILALNCNNFSEIPHKSTLSVYKYDNKYVSIYPTYQTILNNVQTKLADQSIANSENTNYAYTIDFSGGLNGKDHYILIPYTAKTNLLVYMSRNLPMTLDGEVDKSKIPFSVNNYSKSIFINYLDFSSNENRVINELIEQMQKLGYIVEFDIVTRQFDIIYRSLMKYPISDLPVCVNDKNNYNNDYEGNRDKIIFNVYTKGNSTLDNLLISISRYNLRYSISITNTQDGNIIDVENFTGTDLNELIMEINVKSNYVQFDLFADYLPVGTYKLVGYELYSATEITQNINNFLDKVTKTVLFNNRVDILYNYSTTLNIYEKFVQITDNCEKRIMLFSDYITDKTVAKCSCTFKRGIVKTEDLEFDTTFFVLYTLGLTGGFEHQLEFDFSFLNTEPDETEMLINTIYDNVYYYSILNPMCLYNGNKTTLAEGFGFIAILNYALQNISAQATEMSTIDYARLVLTTSINEVGNAVSVLPTVEITDFMSDTNNRQVAIYFETVFDNSIDVSYETIANIALI